MTNPLLSDWNTPFDIPPFDVIGDAHFQPAFDEALSRGREAIKAIADNPEPPTFANTIEAMERADADLSRVLGVFFGVAGADSNPGARGVAAGILSRACRLFIGNHVKFQTVRADCRSVGEARHSGTERRTVARVDAHASQFRACRSGAW